MAIQETVIGADYSGTFHVLLMLWNCLRPFIWSTNNAYMPYGRCNIQACLMISCEKWWHNHLLIVHFFAESSCFLHLDHLVLPVVGDEVRTCYNLITGWHTLMNTPSEKGHCWCISYTCMCPITTHQNVTLIFLGVVLPKEQMYQRSRTCCSTFCHCHEQQKA